MPMPETAIDEDAGTKADEGQVWSTWQGLGMDAITEAMTEEETAHQHLRPRVLRPDSAHAIAALLGSHSVGHILQFFN